MSLRPVAGCLFEVHLPWADDGGAWSWAGGTDAVSLLAATAGRFRFRAERAGEVVLAFEAPAPAGHSPAQLRLPVRIAPEGG